MINKKALCPFCNLDRDIIIESKYSFAIFDNFPVNKGHTLIIPKSHCSNYFELTIEEQKDCFELMNDLKIIIQEKFEPDGYNFGMNINEAAGQTISHVHLHLIPRYKGDIENPEGGIRCVIPNKKTYPSNYQTKRVNLNKIDSEMNTEQQLSLEDAKNLLKHFLADKIFKEAYSFNEMPNPNWHIYSLPKNCYYLQIKNNILDNNSLGFILQSSIVIAIDKYSGAIRYCGSANEEG